AADVVFVSRNRKAAPAVKQHGVEGIADPPRHAYKKVVVCLYERELAGKAGRRGGRKADEAAAAHGRAGGGTFDADDGVAGELKVAAASAPHTAPSRGGGT